MVVLYQGKAWYGDRDLPNSIRRKLIQRRTNTMGYELMAAIIVILLLDKLLPSQVVIRHFVDNTVLKPV